MSENSDTKGASGWRHRAGVVMVYLALRVEGKSRSEASRQARAIVERARSRREWEQRG